MKHSILLLALIAAFAVAACSSTPPAHQVASEQPGGLAGLRGIVGPDCPVR